MGLFDQFPYTNFHNLNLDWIIGQIKNIKSAVTSTAEDAASASHSAEAAAASAGSAAGSAAYAGNAAALVQQVRDDLDTVNTEMTNFVQAHSGLYNETVLWSGTASATGDTITLSDDIRNYKYIDVQATYKGAVSASAFGTFSSNVVRFTPEMFTDDNAVLNIPYAYNDQLQICTVFMFWDSLDPTDYTKISLGYTRRVSINDHGDLDNAADPGTVIVKIVGVKNIADAEVIDARVGEDDTVYSTLKQRLDTEYSDLKSAIAQNSGVPKEVKQAMDTLFAKMAVIDGGGYEDEYSIIHDWASSTAKIVSISAVFNQGDALITTDNALNDLKQYLTVTASYSDGTREEIIGYTLNGTLSSGTSTITVTYRGKSTTFDATVVGWTLEWDYTDGALPSSDEWTTSDTGGTHTVTFESGKGIKWVGTSWGWDVTPKDHTTTTEGVMEIVAEFANLSPYVMIRATLSNGTNCIIGFLTNAGIRVNGQSNDPITGTTINANTAYTLRVERTATSGKVYLNGTLVYDGELRELAGTNNTMFSASQQSGTSVTAYIKSIRFMHIS